MPGKVIPTEGEVKIINNADQILENLDADDEHIDEDVRVGDLTLKEFRVKLHTTGSIVAIESIREYIRKGGTGANICRYITDGREKFCADIISFWQNIGIVAALIGAISITVLLATPSRGDIYVNANNTDQDISYKLYQAYYVLWGVAAYSEIAVVVLVTIASVHFNLMISDEDLVWFVMTWEGPVSMMPQVFLVVGCFSCFFGCIIGSFLVADMTLGLINTSIGVIFVLIVLPTWLYMLHHNKARELKGVQRLEKLMKVTKGVKV